ncbi:MAG: hypothetical protein ACTSU5_13610 [Promethearchaeota archaeon]
MPAEPVPLGEVPITTPAVVVKRYTLLNLLMFYLSALPIAWMVDGYFRGTILPVPGPFLLLLLPLEVFVWWIAWVFCAVLVARLFLGFAKLLHEPRLGVFDASRSDPEFRYWNLRACIRKFGLWAVHTFPMPWIDIPAFKLLGVKQKGGGTAFFDAWVEPENLELGDNTLFGLGSYILTSMVVGGKFISKKTRLGDFTLVGAEAVVGPGASIGNDVVHGSLAIASVDQELEDGWIYLGQPCSKMKVNKMAQVMHYKKTDVVADGRSEADTKFFYKTAGGGGEAGGRAGESPGAPERSAGAEELDGKSGTPSESRAVETAADTVETDGGAVEEDGVKKKQELHYGTYVSSFLVTFTASILLPVLAFYAYYRYWLGPTLVWSPPAGPWQLVPFLGSLDLAKALCFWSIPVVFTSLYLLHVVTFVVVGKVFVSHAERQWPVQRGVYKRDFEVSGKILKYYHYRHFMVRVLKWRVSRSMFPWLVKWAWRFLGIAEIGKDVVLEDHFFPPELLTLGDNSYVGQGVVVGTHTVEGVFGRLVIAGATIRKDCTVMVNVLMGPGGDLEENSHVLPRGALAKAYKLRSGGYYWGVPVYKLSRGQARKILKNVLPKGGE